MPRRNVALPVAAGVLTLFLAAEWLLPGPAAPDWQAPPNIPSGTTEVSGDADVTQWANIVLARPLLSQSRRPAASAGTAISDTLPRLSAIIVIGGSRRAIFAATGQKPELVAEGGEIGLYRIKTVAPDKVDLLGPDGPITVKPQFIAAAPATPAAAQ